MWHYTQQNRYFYDKTPVFCDISSELCRAGIAETPPALRATSPIFVPFRFSKTKEELAPHY